MNARRLLPLLVIAACTPAPPLVSASGSLAAPAYAVAGDGPAAAELQRQLIARGWYAADAPSIIHAGYGVAPRAIGSCTAADTAARYGCKTWHDIPAGSWRPFAPPLRHHLTLVIIGRDAGRIDVVQPAGKSAQPLPALVTAALARLPG